MPHSGELQRTRSGWEGPLRLPRLCVDIVRSAQDDPGSATLLIHWWCYRSRTYPRSTKLDTQDTTVLPYTSRCASVCDTRTRFRTVARVHATNQFLVPDSPCTGRPLPQTDGLRRAGSPLSNRVRESRGGWAGKAEHLPSGSVPCLHPSGRFWIGARPVLARPSALARLSSARFATAAK